MNKRHWAGLAVTGLSLLCSVRAEAHFRLVQPLSWLHEDELGGPQKGSPCGPGNTMLILGDDVQPVPVSNAVSTFSPGQTVSFQLEETVYHPGYFRVSLAHKRAAGATLSDFPNPPLTDPVDCHYDAKAVRTGAHGNVLADGLFMAEGQDGENRSLKFTVQLPKEPCAECSLQVVQVMEGHPGSSCFYFHCADIKIVAGVAGGLADAGEPFGPDAGHAIESPNMADAGRPAAARDAASDATKLRDASTPVDAAGSRDSGGCSLRPTKTDSDFGFAGFWLAAAAIVVARRARRRIVATSDAAAAAM